MAKFTPETARQMGSKGGKAKTNTLTLARVQAELGPLETVDDGMRRLDRLNVWIASGLLSGSQGSASVRAVEVWLRGHESRLTERVVEELHDEVERLKTQIGAKAVSVMR